MTPHPRHFAIAHVTTVDLSLRYLLLNQMQSLREAGYDVAGISHPGPNVAALERAGIRHFSVAMTRNLTPFADLRSLWNLYRLFRRERFVLVHTHTPKAGLLGQLAARMAGVPVVVNTIHGLYLHEQMPAARRRFQLAVERLAGRCSDRILSQNEEDLHTAIREKICKPEKIALLGNGIDLDEFHPSRASSAEALALRARFGIPATAPVIGFVGRLAGRRKGLLDLFAAVRELAARRSAVRLLVVGDPDRGKADAVEPSVAAHFGIAERCHFAGHQPNASLPLFYKAMDVLALPSLFEGIPRVVMEASAMGVPSVVTEVKGNREAVEPGRNGFRVPLGDVRALAAALERVLFAPGLVAQMRCEALRLARERFDERRVFEKVKAEYRALLAAKNVS